MTAGVPALNAYLDRAASSHDGSEAYELPLIIPFNTVRSRGDVRLLLPPAQSFEKGRPDAALIGLVAKAWTARQALMTAPQLAVDEAAAGMGLKPDYFRVLVRLSFLAPDIIAAILKGRQPASLTRQKLARTIDLPMDWDSQRLALGFRPELQEAA